jgi:hypothetical protein
MATKAKHHPQLENIQPIVYDTILRRSADWYKRNGFNWEKEKDEFISKLWQEIVYMPDLLQDDNIIVLS